jgi:raffinose/stachyose/melibiose transport system substrate-binding protein
MKYPRNLLTAGAMTVVLAMSVAACGKSDDSGSATNADKTVTIHVQGWKGGGSEPANIAEINSAFEAAHPKIKVDFEYITSNDPYLQKLQPQLLAGNAGDVIMVDPDKVSKWGTSGYLADLSSEPWAAGIRPETKAFTQNQGKTLAMPMELIGIGLYSNLDLLKKAGIAEVPTTWPDFMTALGKLKAAGINPIALPDKAGWTAESVLTASASTLVYQKNKQWDADFLAGKTTFPTDWNEPLAQLKALSDAGYVNWKNQLGVDEWAQGTQDFSAGKSGFFYQGAWNISTVKKAGVPISFTPWPGGAAGTKPNAMFFTGTMWAVNAKSKQSAAAREYVKFWSDSANLSKYLAAENAVSPFTSGTTPTSAETTNFTTAFSEGRYWVLPSNTWLSGTAETTIGSKLQGYLLGKSDAPQVLKDIQTAATTK